MNTPAPKPVYQPRCVNCGREHYALAVPAISRGLTPCGWCGEVSPVFYVEADYRAALAARKSPPVARGDSRCRPAAVRRAPVER